MCADRPPRFSQVQRVVVIARSACGVCFEVQRSPTMSLCRPTWRGWQLILIRAVHTAASGFLKASLGNCHHWHPHVRGIFCSQARVSLTIYYLARWPLNLVRNADGASWVRRCVPVFALFPVSRIICLLGLTLTSNKPLCPFSLTGPSICGIPRFQFLEFSFINRIVVPQCLWRILYWGLRI